MTRIDVKDDVLELALRGDAQAVERIVRLLQGPFHDLARRMVLSPADAEDVTQEALIRTITHLAQFDRRSRFSTWAWRIAVNACLDARAGRSRAPLLSEAEFAADLEEGLDTEAPERPDDAAALAEVKVGCGIAMLATLDADHRVAYVLGEILELPPEEAAQVLGVTPAAFRKRLSRSRHRVADMLRSWCGIAREENACRCHRRLERARSLGRVSPAPGPPPFDLPSLRAQLHRMEALRAAAAYYRADGHLEPGADFVSRIRDLLRTAGGEG
jgi:RNA polymerase sigma factor (sigma-70 family)